MFNSPFSQQQNPLITQIRMELRGHLPDQWVAEVVMILEYQLPYQTLVELDTESIRKLQIAAEKSPTLHECLNRIVQQIQVQAPQTNQNYRSPNPPSPPSDWQRYLPWNTD